MSSKREDLLITAERLFYAHGFHAIGLKAIVQEAGVALMTLYNHFASKEELILEILNRREQAYFDLLKKVIDEEMGTVQEKLTYGHLLWLKNSASNGCMFLRAKEEFSSEPNHSIVTRVNSHKENLIHFIQTYGLPRIEALKLSLLCEGSTSMAETTDIKEVEEVLMSLVDCIEAS
ncbi:TetR family transcriptional regulator [Planomicrobium sp. Y74]|uniref:TetR/AcrR family transcriptional regulator n=1 Tax=Planomicrobium sp. Y74 TaxID=2478977 RepID=UPI000EF51934|nr:TetR family transcriptional regulator [Planomicrobium sp. Y74]RLQ90134.1 TetR/AcrR family transcriptional regulator [Planomicrobium sp. Y74]